MYHFTMDGPKSEKHRLVIAGGSDRWSDESPSDAGAGGWSLMIVEVGKTGMASSDLPCGVSSTTAVSGLAREVVEMAPIWEASCGGPKGTAMAAGAFWEPGPSPGLGARKVTDNPELTIVFSPGVSPLESKLGQFSDGKT